MALASAWEEMGGRTSTPRTPTHNFKLQEGELLPRVGGGPDLLLESPPFFTIAGASVSLLGAPGKHGWWLIGDIVEVSCTCTKHSVE